MTSYVTTAGAVLTMLSCWILACLPFGNYALTVVPTPLSSRHRLVQQRQRDGSIPKRPNPYNRANTFALRASSHSSDKGEEKNVSNSRKVIPKDIVVIGSGLAGLSTALHIASSSSRQVTILERCNPLTQTSQNSAAGSYAAAGMLAPQSERLPSGPLLDLCVASREMYGDFVHKVETLARNAGEDARRYLWKQTEWNVGYKATGGFLAPAFAGDTVATWAPPSIHTAKWLDNVQIHEMEPYLHPDVIGGWWFPEDASVDARRLTCALRAACVESGVHFMWGEECGVASLDLVGGKCAGVRLNDGRYLAPDSVLVANGSWMRELLPVPITPHKGQSFSLRMPPTLSPLLSRVLFAQDTYIVPKPDGRIIVGATIEPGSFDGNVTPAGMMHCISNAVQLVPALADLTLEEMWAGLRPTTPDKGPIIGCASQCASNVYLAGGYWRNGVLLAPKTAQLVGDLMLGQELNLDDQALLKAFSWDRFISSEDSKNLAVNTRYAASMHPVHSRSSGTGIAAAVGTELGFYSKASSAKAEREKDRLALFGTTHSLDKKEKPGVTSLSHAPVGGKDTEDELFEKAARMGVSDGLSFSFGTVSDNRDVPHPVWKEPELPMSFQQKQQVPVALDKDDDADTDAIIKNEVFDNDDCATITDDDIRSIGANSSIADEDAGMRPLDQYGPLDSGSRISQTLAEGEYEQQVSSANKPPHLGVESSPVSVPELSTAARTADTTNVYDETTYDGYTIIQQANSKATRLEELQAMKNARMANRIKTSEIDESEIGAMRMPEETVSSEQSPVVKDRTFPTSWNASAEESQTFQSQAGVNMADVYAQIKASKAAQMVKTSKQPLPSDDRPDPGFRIYRVDPETRESYEVPPYTSPAEMDQIIAKHKMAKQNGDNSSEEANIGSEARFTSNTNLSINKTFQDSTLSSVPNLNRNEFNGRQQFQQ